MGTADIQRGYMVMDLIIGGVALMLSALFFVLASRRKRASGSTAANYAAS